MRVLGRLGAVCRTARKEQGLHALVIAQAAGVSEPTISRVENGLRWVDDIEAIVEAYERELRLPDGELWRRAVSSSPPPPR